MEESWPINVWSKLPRRRSTDPAPDSTKMSGFFGSESEILDPSEFNDVFGGPPRSVYLRRFSGDFSTSFYDEIFRPMTEFDSHTARKGRNLPLFRIPSTNNRRDGFYDDIFGPVDDRRSRSRSKSNSSSVLSSEDLSPLRPSGHDDVGISTFASKLRPIIVPSRQSSSSTLSRERRRQGSSVAPYTRSSFKECQFTETSSNDLLLKSHFGFCHRMSSPETISLEPSSHQSIKISIDDLDIGSPSSEISYVGCDPDPAIKTHGQSLQELEEEEEEEEHNDAEYLGSYVIEIGSERREEIEEAINVDEAIAWVKEKSQSRKSEDFSIGYQQQNMVKWAHLETESSPEARQKIDEGRQVVFECLTQPKSDFEKTQFLMARVSQELKRRETSQETHQYDQDMEMRLIEEDIKRWSERKEGNIRSLLATLQYILWPELKPNTKYYYRCGDPSIHAMSNIHFFKTMPVSAPWSYPKRIAVVGDLGLTYNTTSTIDHLRKNRPNLILLIGDVTYANLYLTNGTGSDCYSCAFADTPIHETYQPRWDYWGRFMEPLVSKVPLMVVEGNHEKEEQAENKTFTAYSSRFAFPSQESGSSSTLYYSFNAGGIHFVMLGAYFDFHKSGQQYKWLKRDLQNVDRSVTPWLVAVWHPPWYSSYRAHYKEAECMRLEIEDLLYSYGIDVVFNGHVHAYERSNRVYNYTLDPCGPVHIVIGDGGNREKMAISHADEPGHCPGPLTEMDLDLGSCAQNFSTGPAAGKFCWDRQPNFSAFRDSSFGHGILEVVNETYALWTWHKNQDSYGSPGDQIYIVRQPDKCPTKPKVIKQWNLYSSA